MLIVAAIGSVNAIFLATLFFKNLKPNRIANRLAAVLFLIIAIRLGKVLAQASDLSLIRSVYFNLMHGAFLAMGPVLLFYTRTLKSGTAWKPVWFTHFIPTLLALIGASFIRAQTSPGTWLRVYEFILLAPVPYLIISGKIIVNKESQSKQLWPLRVLTLVGIIWFLNCLFYWVEFPFYWVTGILVTSLFYLFLLALKPGSYLSREKYQNLALSPEKSTAIFQKADAIIREEALYKEANLKLDQLSERLGISTHLLSGAINSATGQSYPHYLHALRIEAAKGLILMQPEAKVAAIAFEVGYQSLSTFNTAFKKHTGLTPTRFKANNSRKTLSDL